MNATCRPFSIASTDASSATIVLPDPTSPCSSRFIGCGTLHVLADVLQRLPLSGRQVKWQHGAHHLADPVVHLDGESLALGIRFATPQQQAHLKPKELLEDQAALRRCAERIELVQRSIGRRKVRGLERLAPAGHPQRLAHRLGQWLRQVRRHLQEGVGDEPPLHLRRDRSRALVDRDDAAGVKRFGLIPVDDLELRVRDLESRPLVPLERAVHHHLGAGVNLVLQICGVEPREADGARGVAQQRLEDAHARTSRAAQAAGDHLAGDRHGLPLAQRRDRLQMAAIFVAERETEEQILDGIQPGAREVGGLAGADSLQELQRRLQEVGGGWHRPGRFYCTTSAWPIVVRISRMRAGRRKGASKFRPSGWLSLFE